MSHRRDSGLLLTPPSLLCRIFGILRNFFQKGFCVMKSALSLFLFFLHLFLFHFFSKHIRCFTEVWICSALESTQATNIWETAPNQPTDQNFAPQTCCFSKKTFLISSVIKQIKYKHFILMLDVSSFTQLLSFSFGILHRDLWLRFFSQLKTLCQSAHFGTNSKSLVSTTKSVHRNHVILFLFPPFK